MPPTDRFVSPGVFGDSIPHQPRFRVGDCVTTSGTRPGACHYVLECMGVITTDIKRRWYMIDIGGVPVSICENDLELVEVVNELGRIARG